MTETAEQTYTPEQIEELCEYVEALGAPFLCVSCREEGKLLFDSVQIIRQLQEEVRAWSDGTMTCNSSNFKVFE